MWKHERSTSRANEITKKAEREMSLIEDEMDNVSELSDKYGKAVTQTMIKINFKGLVLQTDSNRYA